MFENIGELLYQVKMDLAKVDQDIKSLQSKFDKHPIKLKFAIDDNSLKDIVHRIQSAVTAALKGSAGSGAQIPNAMPQNGMGAGQGMLSTGGLANALSVGSLNMAPRPAMMSVAASPQAPATHQMLLQAAGGSTGMMSATGQPIFNPFFNALIDAGVLGAYAQPGQASAQPTRPVAITGNPIPLSKLVPSDLSSPSRMTRVIRSKDVGGIPLSMFEGTDLFDRIDSNPPWGSSQSSRRYNRQKGMILNPFSLLAATEATKAMSGGGGGGGGGDDISDRLWGGDNEGGDWGKKGGNRGGRGGRGGRRGLNLLNSSFIRMGVTGTFAYTAMQFGESISRINAQSASDLTNDPQSDYNYGQGLYNIPVFGSLARGAEGVGELFGAEGPNEKKSRELSQWKFRLGMEESRRESDQTTSEQNTQAGMNSALYSVRRNAMLGQNRNIIHGVANKYAEPYRQARTLKDANLRRQTLSQLDQQVERETTAGVGANQASIDALDYQHMVPAVQGYFNNQALGFDISAQASHMGGFFAASNASTIAADRKRISGEFIGSIQGLNRNDPNYKNALQRSNLLNAQLDVTERGMQLAEGDRVRGVGLRTGLISGRAEAQDLSNQNKPFASLLGENEANYKAQIGDVQSDRNMDTFEKNSRITALVHGAESATGAIQRQIRMATTGGRAYNAGIFEQFPNLSPREYEPPENMQAAAARARGMDWKSVGKNASEKINAESKDTNRVIANAGIATSGASDVSDRQQQTNYLKTIAENSAKWGTAQ